MSTELTPMEGQEPRKRKKHNARNKGYSAERKYARIFREAGWDKAVTMRYVSKMKDDHKIDVAFIPINLQVKAGIQTGLSPSKLLSLIDEYAARLPDHFPEKHQISAVVHEKQIQEGWDKEGNKYKRTPYDSLVYMTFDDFFKLICMLYEKGKYKPTISTAMIEVIDDLINSQTQTGS